MGMILLTEQVGKFIYHQDILSTLIENSPFQFMFVFLTIGINLTYMLCKGL